MDTMSAPACTISVPVLLGRLADELRTLEAIARALPSPSGRADDATLAAAQNQDLLEQTLDELAGFLRAGAAHFGEEARGDLGEALSRIRLSAPAGRLAGAPGEPAAREGDLDLF